MTFFTNIANILAKYWRVFLLQGIGYTLLLSVIAVAGGAFFGSLLALAKRSKLKVLKGFVNALVGNRNLRYRWTRVLHRATPNSCCFCPGCF